MGNLTVGDLGAISEMDTTKIMDGGVVELWDCMSVVIEQATGIDGRTIAGYFPRPPPHPWLLFMLCYFL